MKSDFDQKTDSDELDRLFALSRPSDQAPAGLLNATLEELRKSATGPGRIRPRTGGFFNRRLALAGLGTAAGLAGLVLVVSALGLLGRPAEPSGPTQLAAQPTGSVSLAVPSPSPTMIVIKESVAATSMNTSPTGDPTNAASGQTPSQSTPGPTPSLPSNINPSLVIETPLTGPTPRPSNTGPTTVSGTLTGFDRATNTLTLSRAGGTLNLKIAASVVIRRQGVTATLNDLKLGEPITITYSLNAQGQAEITNLELSPLNIERPIGPPGYPDEKK